MKLLVCGGRDYADKKKLEAVLGFFLEESIAQKAQLEVVIHGDARGADKLADEWALGAGLSVQRFPADWKKHGRAAGPIRNQEMLDIGQPDWVIAFPGGRGTEDMVKRARAAGIPTYEVKPREPEPKTRIVATPQCSDEGTCWVGPGDTYVDNETGARISLLAAEKRSTE